MSGFDAGSPAGSGRKFLWGVATSAYQSEGGYHGAGQPVTNWAEAEAAGEVARVGAAVDFWNRYEEDFARCRSMGLNAFRMGIEWSRAQPAVAEGEGPAPGFDGVALDHYARMLAACRASGMEPVVTLHHFVHPAWLGPDPWLHERTPGLFARFVEVAVAHVNRRLTAVHGMEPLRYFITINEPNMLVLNTYAGNQFPGKGGRGVGSVVDAYNYLLVGHVHAYNALHDLYEKEGWARPMVTFNNYCSDLYWSDKLLLDLVACRERGVARSEVGAYVHRQVVALEQAFAAEKIPLRKDFSYWAGSVVKSVSDGLGWRWFKPERFAPLLQAVYESPRERLLDYIGLDYYDPFTAHAFRFPVFWDHEFRSKTLRDWLINSVTSKWWDWRVLPRGMHFFCRYYAEDFQKPVLIAENGMALRRRVDNTMSSRRDKMRRSDFLKAHVREVVRMVAEGVPLLGYLHWSLFDNYEWGSYTPRFGLYAMDYLHGLERHVEDHYGDRPSVTYAGLIRQARMEMGER